MAKKTTAQVVTEDELFICEFIEALTETIEHSNDSNKTSISDNNGGRILL